LNLLLFSRICRRANSWLICQTESLLGNAVVPRLRRVKGGYAVLWRRLYTLHSVGICRFLANKFIALLVTLDTVSLGPAFRSCLVDPNLLDHLDECIYQTWFTVF
jgi:hypothetical protein